MPTDGEVTIDLKSNNGDIDTYLNLHDANGQRIERNNNGGFGTDSHITRELTAGIYFITASSYRSRSTGSTELTVTRTVSDRHTDAPGDLATDLDLSSGSASVDGRLETAGDRDAFGFTLTETRSIQIDLLKIGSEFVDTYLRLYDAAGNLITYNDDSGYRLNSRITVTLGAGRYFLTAASYRDRGFGDYRLALELS
jgi:hypothetical protein